MNHVVDSGTFIYLMDNVDTGMILLTKNPHSAHYVGLNITAGFLSATRSNDHRPQLKFILQDSRLLLYSSIRLGFK